MKRSSSVNKKKKLQSLQNFPQKQRASLPEFIHPELAPLVSSIPKKNNWLFEIKYDGYRLLAIIKGRKITLKTRNNNDWSRKFPQLIQALEKLPIENAIIDGEIVVLDKDRISNFGLLQNAIQSNDNSIINYYVFDLLYYDKYYLGNMPLRERRQILKKLFGKSHKHSLIQFSEDLRGNINQIMMRLCKKGYEGIVAKNQESAYQSRRTKDWLKIKCKTQQEFVICGYTNPSGSREFFGALLLGYFTKNKKLVYCGKVGTGFNRLTLRTIFSYLQKISQVKSNFTKTPAAKGIHWVKPKLVAEIAFKEWTADGYLRQSVFQGLRFDKAANEIVKEIPHDKRDKKLSGISNQSR